MKRSWTLLFLVALPLASWAQGGGPPSSTGASQEEPPSISVAPGQKHTNGDGVTVENSPKKEGGKGNAGVNPAKGDSSSATSVNCKEYFNGSISGLDANDNVTFGAHSSGIVSGAGGSVSLAGNSTISVTNTAPTGGPSTTVALPGGITVTLSPGSTGTFGT